MPQVNFPSEIDLRRANKREFFHIWRIKKLMTAMAKSDMSEPVLKQLCSIIAPSAETFSDLLGAAQDQNVSAEGAIIT